MDQKAAPQETGFVLPIPRWEFIAMAAGLMALNALAVDVMLPGLQQIGASLGVENENHRQYVISAYILGFGGAQLFYGPISDRFGRRGPLLFGLVVYIAAAFAAAFAPSFGLLLALRFVQGIGAAATRVIAVSFIRDVFGGRRMAEVMSLVFMVFMVIPVIAPAVGQLIMLFSEWHMIFIFMAVVAAAISVWTALRMPETMHPEYRRPLTAGSIIGGFGVVLRTRVALFYTLATTAIFGALFGFINSAQQIYVGHLRARRLVPGALRLRCRHDGGVVLPQFAAGRPFRHAPAVARRADRLPSGQHDLAAPGIERPDTAGLVRHSVRVRDGAIRLDRIELQLDRHGAARPRRRDSLIDAGFHADARRRRDRRDHRPAVRRDSVAAGYRLLERVGAWL